MVFIALAAAGHGRIEGEGSEMKYIPISPLLVDVGDKLVAPPIAQNFTPEALRITVGENGDLTQAKNISEVPSKQAIPETSIFIEAQPIHQFTKNEAQSIVSLTIEPIGDPTNSPPITPIPNLAILLLQSTTWVEISEALRKDSQKLIEAMNNLDKPQRKTVGALLIEFLCNEPQKLKELSWLPKKMLGWVFKRLTFAISQISGEGSSIDNARMERVENLSYVSVEGLGSSKELWIFSEVSSGRNIPVFGTDGICGISVRN